jgi:hypothetical protein
MTDADDTPDFVYNVKRDRSVIVFRVILVLVAVSVVVFLYMSQLFAWGEVQALRRRVNQVVQDSRLEQLTEDCLSLYRNDVSTSIGLALAANNNMWVSAATRDPNLSDEERIAQNQALGQLLHESNLPLEKAVAALAEYERLDPEPKVCPHPRGRGLRGDD